MKQKQNPNEEPTGEPVAQELAWFRPAPPSASLKERIRRVAEAEEVRSPSWWATGTPLRWAMAAVLLILGAVGVGVVFKGLWQPQSPVQLAETLPLPHEVEVEEETLWGDGEVKGIVETKDGPPMWKVRYETVRRTAWSDEHGATQVRFVPEERLLFLPVSYN